jgi:phosphoribulokinase
VSVKHPIISVTGSSGAGTTSVRRTFEQIFRREAISAAFIENDAFHRYDRADMKAATYQERKKNNFNFSHFGPEANILEELESIFCEYSEHGTGRTRHYVHDVEESKSFGQPPGTFTPWEDLQKQMSVEAELGCLGSLETLAGEREDGHGAEGKLTREQLLTDPDEAARFVDETQCEALAIAIGTSHDRRRSLP